MQYERALRKIKKKGKDATVLFFYITNLGSIASLLAICTGRKDGKIKGLFYKYAYFV